ncbi:hypothetical protein BIU82_18490 [Arthrobacter sp. SW1]|nr:hypothetical protein BIU82_18490 [Arthrobacter sp. SW1]
MTRPAITWRTFGDASCDSALIAVGGVDSFPEARIRTYSSESAESASRTLAGVLVFAATAARM